MTIKNRLDQLLDFYKNNPDDSFILFAVAKEYENIERWDKALQFYLNLKNKDPDYIGLYYHLAKLYEKINETQLALQTYNEGLDLGQRLKDFHAVSELNNAKMNLEIELGN